MAMRRQRRIHHRTGRSGLPKGCSTDSGERSLLLLWLFLRGLVAYEMANLLSKEGDKVGMLALLDAPNPALLSNLSADESARFRKTYLSDRIGKYANDLLKGNIQAFAQRGFAFLVSRLGRHFLPALKFGLRSLDRSVPAVIQSNDPGFLKAWRAYVPEPYAGSVVCFRLEERGPEHDFDPTMGWGASVVGRVFVHVVPGGHVDMMRMPSVAVIAEAMTEMTTIIAQLKRS
jgi:thioesterase domain-containing protein